MMRRPRSQYRHRRWRNASRSKARGPSSPAPAAASAGASRAASRQEGAELILTGRRKDVLDSLASELGAEAIVSDLSLAQAPEQLLACVGPRRHPDRRTPCWRQADVSRRSIRRASTPPSP